MNPSRSLLKTPTGIAGLDEITGGGLPTGRPTIITGSAGCGKTLFGVEFLVRGITEYGEPGVLMAFEETAEELTANVRSLGFDLDQLVAEDQLVLDHVHVERSEIEETGEYDLEGLFIRLGFAIDSIGAKRVVLDTLEALFTSFPDPVILRAELRRLFRWLKEKGVTAVITAERGQGSLTRHGLEEYVSDCVILLDHRTTDQITTRRLRIVKYRGSSHGTNEYPFLIDEDGISILPITSLNLNHSVSTEHISTGVERLDAMLSGKGYYRGSSILVSGTAGAGKSSLAAHLAHATAQRGERTLYFAFEESEQQIIRNMRSIGLDLQPWVDQDLLRFHAARPTLQGLEMHLVTMYKLIQAYQPHVVIIDPITNFTAVGNEAEVKSALVRLIDNLKSKHITAFFTSLTSDTQNIEQTQIGISSLIDTWLLVRMIESNGERNRGLYVLKARGMAHSNQIREFQLTDRGIQLLDVYQGSEGVLTGTARLAQEAREQAEALVRWQEIERKQRELERKRQALDTQIDALRAEFRAEEEEMKTIISQVQNAETTRMNEEIVMTHRRGGEPVRDEPVDRDKGESLPSLAKGEA
ncbi:MAG: circadian clock protein KaiC [Caldilineaceae bacterium]|nr:circadian clock protein KaiC [Caldilineaceae bacterium]